MEAFDQQPRDSSPSSGLLHFSVTIDTADYPLVTPELAKDTMRRALGIFIAQERIEITRVAAQALPEAEMPMCLGLSKREEEVLELLGTQGLTNKEIGMRLDISPRTVKEHLSSVMGKLGLTSRTQVANYYHRYTEREDT